MQWLYAVVTYGTKLIIVSMFVYAVCAKFARTLLP